jgi:heme o synthase
MGKLVGGAGQGSAVSNATSTAAPSSVPIVELQTANTIGRVVSDYVQLMKPRIVLMILVTTTATAIIGADGFVPALPLLWLLLATGAVAASAGAANQVWERVIDQKMKRTASRPLPSGRMKTFPSIVYTALLGLVGSGLLQVMFGTAPAMAGVATWLLYVLVYTPMKTRSAWNTTIGAVAGALPVLIGYTATGGTLTDVTGWLLVGVLVAWQYPHFMSIAWMYRRQYAEAGFQMTTTVDPSGRSAGWQSILGSLALILCSIALCCLPGGWIGSVVATVAVGLVCLPMLRASFRFAADPTDVTARKLLRSSLLVLPGVLAVVVLRVFW